jgi:hypothetical protein
LVAVSLIIQRVQARQCSSDVGYGLLYPRRLAKRPRGQGAFNQILVLVAVVPLRGTRCITLNIAGLMDLSDVMPSIMNSVSNRPSFSIRSKSGVVGGACKNPAIAQGMAARSMKSFCCSKISSVSESKPMIKPAVTQRPWF